MVVLRFLGWLLIIFALAVLLNDIWRSIQVGHWMMIKSGQLWFDLDRDSLQLAQPAVERHIARWLWFPVIATILEWPAALVLGIPGLLLALLFRRRVRIGQRRIFARK
jgi:hypothetical protein